MTGSWEGLLLLDKPSGPTSHDLIDRVRRMTGQRRIGHGGTLDPLACGLLPLVLGPATRLVRFLPHSPKTYSGTIRLGLATDTDDVTGQVLHRGDGALPDATAVAATARTLTGVQLQAPPVFSARKVEGRRSYRRARDGDPVQPPATEVEVFRFELAPTEQNDVYGFEAEVTGGTYIRALARDLGQRLGCGATLATLRRTRIGPMMLEQAVSADPATDPEAADLAAHVIPPERMPLVPPPLTLGDRDAESFALGRRVRVDPGAVPEGFCRVLTLSGRLLGVAEAHEGLVQPRVVVAPRAGR